MMQNSNRRVVCFVCALFVLSILNAGLVQAKDYENTNWGFRLALPAPAIDCIYEPTSPDHGVLIHLDGQDCQGPVVPPRMAISVFYDALDYGSLQKTAEKDCPEGHIISPLTFGPLAMAECRTIETNGLIIGRLVAFRSIKDREPVLSHTYAIWWNRRWKLQLKLLRSPSKS